MSFVKSDTTEVLHGGGSEGYAEQGMGFELFADITGINTGSFTQIITRTVPSDKTDFYTDICFSATSNGIVRMKVNGYIICTKYYGANTEYDCARKTPWKMNADSTILIEYKPVIDGACAACNAGGYSK